MGSSPTSGTILFNKLRGWSGDLVLPDFCNCPDVAPFSRRSQHLDLVLSHLSVREPLHLVIDSTGLSVFGKGEWAAAKHGRRGKRGWRSSISMSTGLA